MISSRPLLPMILLTGLILIPVAVITVAGMFLLRNEQARLTLQTRNANQLWLDQTSEDMRQGLTTLKSNLIRELETILTETNRANALLDLRDRHPLVRNVFWVRSDGERLMPPGGMQIDLESRRFLQRYASLFQERTPWFPHPADRSASSVLNTYSSNEVLDSWNVRQEADAPPSGLRSRWKSWQWEDKNSLLLYIEDPQSDIFGVEVEMTALYSRLDVLLRSLARPGVPLVLLDRQDRVLLSTEETQVIPDGAVTEIGPELPFARMVTAPTRNPFGADGGKAFLAVATGLGLMLVLSIVGGTLGLTAIVRRSRREAMQRTSFVSNVSHEFKTPLTTLRLYSELLLEDRVHDPERRKHYLRTLKLESERLARLVHNVLDFSRLEMERRRLTLEPVLLPPHLTKLKEQMAERFQEADMKLHIEAAGPVSVKADPDALDQILLNLADNAVKYAAEGKNLLIRILTEGKTVQVEFRDKGEGISHANRKRVFKPFVQLDDRLTRKQSGTGLGLHICRRLARQMGGDLVLSPSDTGSCFILTLPVITGDTHD